MANCLPSLAHRAGDLGIGSILPIHTHFLYLPICLKRMELCPSLGASYGYAKNLALKATEILEIAAFPIYYNLLFSEQIYDIILVDPVQRAFSGV